MMSAKSVFSSLFKMTRHVAGARHVMAKYQVKSKEEFQQNVVNADKPTVVYFSDPMSATKLDAAIASAEEDEIDLAIVDIIKYIKNQKIE